MNGWLTIEKAPLDELGLLWCAEVNDRTDIFGKVSAYSDGTRTTFSQWQGFDFTHWHPLPSPPIIS